MNTCSCANKSVKGVTLPAARRFPAWGIGISDAGIRTNEIESLGPKQVKLRGCRKVEFLAFLAIKGHLKYMNYVWCVKGKGKDKDRLKIWLFTSTPSL